jgi:nucleoredoxin
MRSLTRKRLYLLATLNLVALCTALYAGQNKVEAEQNKASPEIQKLFGNHLRTADDKRVSVDILGGKIVGIYFSAHWCPPCKVFTPQLVEFYDMLKAEQKPFELVFVSADRSEDAMYEYMREMKMKWVALPYGNKRMNALSKKFNVRGIPKLVILNTKGEVITEDGRSSVSGSGTKVFPQWEKKL